MWDIGITGSIRNASAIAIGEDGSEYVSVEGGGIHWQAMAYEQCNTIIQELLYDLAQKLNISVLLAINLEY